MHPRHLLLVVTFASIVVWPAIARGAVTGWNDVIVRIYDADDVTAGTNMAALAIASKTLSAASIEVIWQRCATIRHRRRATSESQTHEARCDAPMAPGELAIRIVRSGMPEGDHSTLPLGYALIDTRAGAGVLATIYIDRILWLAREAKADSQALLGRAIAHELGHLLLASSGHGPFGLMRAFWSRDEVQRGQRRDWTFAPAELAAMSARVSRLASWGRR